MEEAGKARSHGGMKVGKAPGLDVFFFVAPKKNSPCWKWKVGRREPICTKTESNNLNCCLYQLKAFKTLKLPPAALRSPEMSGPSISPHPPRAISVPLSPTSARRLILCLKRPIQAPYKGEGSN